jgi:hypothetical protein
MRFRKLRFVWSISWGIAAVLLVALWVRSYWWNDGIIGGGTQFTIIDIEWGVVAFERIAPNRGEPESWHLFHNPITHDSGGLGFRWDAFANGWLVAVPVWLPTTISAAIAVIPWMRWTKRFSLRTLLVATTAVALFLGAVIYAVRK